MGRYAKKCLSILLIAVFITAGYGVSGNSAIKAAESKSIQDTLGLDSSERSAIYDTLTFEPKYMYKGQVISEKPYAVVTKVAPHQSMDAAVIRVWTGIISRDGNHLDTGWDEIWVGKYGNVTVSATDNPVRLENYFAADDQKKYITEDNLGIFPWAVQIATDAEAHKTNQAVIPTDGIINYYGIKFKDIEIQMSTQQNTVKAATHIPVVGAALEVPRDGLNSWAIDHIIHLLKQDVINGYADGTIRPQGTLTRAEFVTLLNRALDLQAESNSKISNYGDVANHWAKAEVMTAIQNGVVPAPASGDAFRPDARITRIEMAVMIDKATQRYPLANEAKSLTFKDTGNLGKEQLDALKVATGLGLLSGYPDGTFQPEKTLSRAEAFKVVSVLVDLVQ